MLHRFKMQFEKIIAPISRIFERNNISPNFITVTGFVLTVISSIAFGQKKFYLALFILTIAGILDGVDGMVARQANKITRFGGFLDSTLDRFAEIAIGAGILYSFHDNTHLFPTAAFLVFVAITGALMTSYVRARGQSIGFDPEMGIMQRADRGVVLGICALIGQRALLAGVLIIAIFSYLTVFQRIYAVWKSTRG